MRSTQRGPPSPRLPADGRGWRRTLLLSGGGNQEVGGNNPLGSVKAGVEVLRLALEAMPRFFGTDKGPIPASTEAQDKTG